MNYRVEEIDIIPDNPFANCKLGRERYAKILEQILSKGSDGCVMLLNGSWGTGKTRGSEGQVPLVLYNAIPASYDAYW